MIIGKRIKELRIERGLSLQKLANEIGVDKHAIIFLEIETNEPKANYIVKLAKYFDVSSDYLLGLTDNY